MFVEESKEKNNSSEIQNNQLEKAQAEPKQKSKLDDLSFAELAAVIAFLDNQSFINLRLVNKSYFKNTDDLMGYFIGTFSYNLRKLISDKNNIPYFLLNNQTTNLVLNGAYHDSLEKNLQALLHYENSNKAFKVVLGHSHTAVTM